MDSKLAVVSIVVDNRNRAPELNTVLHDYNDYIIGRMGLPYPKRDCNIISVAVDGPVDVIDELCDKIEGITDITAKVAFSNVKDQA